MLHSSKIAKTTAVILFIVTVFLVAVSAVAAIFMASDNAYSDGGIRLRENIAERIYHMSNDKYFDFAIMKLNNKTSNEILNSYEEQLSRHNSNLVVFAYDAESDEPIYQTSPNIPDHIYRFESEWFGHIEIGDGRNPPAVRQIRIDAYLVSELTAKDSFYYLLGITDFFIAARYAVIWVAVISLIAAITLLIFLIRAAGHVRGSDEIRLGLFDRIPFDLTAVGYFFAVLISIWLLDELSLYNDIAALIGLVIAFAFWMILLYTALLTVAVRIKAGTIWRNTVIWRLLVLVWRGILLLAGVIAKLPLYWKTALGFLILTGLEFFPLAVGYEAYIPFWVISRPLILALLIYLVLMFRRLEKGGKELEAGNTDYRVNTAFMPSDFRRHGENLNNLSEGLNRAVEERMKSERMKAELITNVSHDIKTPLTSIINYVDLLKTGGLDSPDAPQYLDVLDHQSARLKKLTEDLIEASKASTGAVACLPEPTDVNVLLTQALGEYEERLREAGIEPILRPCPIGPVIFADGRLLWRVFDNLFSNIRKYAMPATRAYFSCTADNQNVCISFRNISSDVLDTEGDELTERFVRGDSSRSTEGSGLGLSIARSLTELMGGSMRITVDGDLFKAEIFFPLYQK